MILQVDYKGVLLLGKFVSEGDGFPMFETARLVLDLILFR